VPVRPRIAFALAWNGLQWRQSSRCLMNSTDAGGSSDPPRRISAEIARQRLERQAASRLADRAPAGAVLLGR